MQLHHAATHQCVGRCRIRRVAAAIYHQDPQAASRHQHGGGSTGAAGANHQHVVAGMIEHCLAPLLGRFAIRLRQMALDVLRQLHCIEADAVDEVRPSAAQEIQAEYHKVRAMQ